MSKTQTTEGKYRTEIGAKRAAGNEANACIVRFADGSFDWFPLGHPIGEFVNGQFVRARRGYDIVARCRIKANGDTVWRVVEEEDERELDEPDLSRPHYR
jgi:hypothetical protein